VPDCIRAIINRENIIVRNPFSIRPYQHVLDPPYAYLMIAAVQYTDKKYEGCYNVGPDEDDCYQTRDLVELVIKEWGDKNISWVNLHDGGPHESVFLKLDCTKIKRKFNWVQRWSLEFSIEKVIQWYKCWESKGDLNKCMDKQIEEFMCR